MKARSLIALTFTVGSCMLVGRSVVAQDLRIVGTNLYDFSGISTLGSTDSPYIVAGIVQEAAPARVHVRQVTTEFRMDPHINLATNGPREMLGAMAAAKMAEKPLTAGQVLALSPNLRQYVKKIEHVRDAILLNYPEPCEPGQNLRACAVPVDGKPSVYDYGMPTELGMATNFSIIYHVYASDIRTETLQHFLASFQTDVHKAFVRHSSQSTEGRVYSQFLLGLDYWYGQGTPTNLDEGMKWIQKAALAGNPKAMTLLGDSVF